MSDEAEWGPWIEHDGKGCPCVGYLVRAIIGPDGSIQPEDVVGGWTDGWKEIAPDQAIGIAVDNGSWRRESGWFPVVRYQVKKPRALLDLIQLIADLPAPVKTDGVIA